MARTYLFIYSDDMGSREAVRDFVDGCSDILHWRHDLPNTFYLVSDLSAHDLAQTVHAFNQGRGRFLICEVGTNKQGWLPQRTWRLLNGKAAPEEQATEHKQRATG